jgi:hypothetical protein
VFNFSDFILTVPSGEPLPPAEKEVLITRIREHVKSNGIRLAGYFKVHFKDSDPLM